MMKSVVCCLACVALCACAIDVKFPEIPKAKGVGASTFTPGPFPCAYTAFYSMSVYPTPYGRQKVYGYHVMYEKQLGTFLVATYPSQNYVYRYIARTDIKPSEYSQYWTAFNMDVVGPKGNNICDHYSVSDLSDYDRISRINRYITGDRPYTSVSQTQWHDKNCTRYNYVYKDETESLDISYYVDSDNLVYGFEHTSNGVTYSGLVTYEMNSAYENDFIVPSGFSGCEDYPKAFEPPPRESSCSNLSSGTRPEPQYPDLGLSSSSQGAGAFNVPFVFAVILSILCAFF